MLRDQEKEINDGKTITKQSSGLAFCEFSEPEIALFAVRYLNNLQLSGNRGLVVDFCLEDARKVFARTQKLEKHQRIALEKKSAQKKEVRNEKRSQQKEDHLESTKNEGEGIIIGTKRKHISVTECNDVEML